MRRIVLAALTVALTSASAYAQTVFEHVRTKPERQQEFLEKLAAENGLPDAVAAETRLPDVVSAESRTDFTVRGSVDQEVDLPHPLTAGTWTVSLTASGTDMYSFWLDTGNLLELEELFCQNLLCDPFVHPTRRILSVNRTTTALIDPITSTGTWAVRFVKDGSEPPAPTPDPDPPCTPTTDVLQFDGGYTVRMCYVTAEGVTGQAQAGVWASSQSGILWFFSRENAEVLVKVLDGCEYNGHRWVFAAPVTDVGFELRVTAPDGETWSHTNEVGTTASTKSDTTAFTCR